MTNWEEVDVPRGAYIGWGMKPGQHVTGKVLEYSIDGGADFYDKPCPQIAIELTEAAASFNKAGDRTDHDPGVLVQLSAGQVSLKRALRAADPTPGDLVKITLDNILKGQGKNGGDIKEFSIKIARGAGASAKPAAASSAPAQSDDDPPF